MAVGAAVAAPTAAGGTDITCESGVPGMARGPDSARVACGTAIEHPEGGDLVGSDTAVFSGVGVPGETVYVVQSEGVEVCRNEVNGLGLWACPTDWELQVRADEPFTPFQTSAEEEGDLVEGEAVYADVAQGKGVFRRDIGAHTRRDEE